MNKVIDFETYLIISQQKFEIYILDIKNFKNLFRKELNYESDSAKIDLNLLSEFLEKNIFEIEKLAGSFVNNLNIIIESNSIFRLDLSIKKKNYSGNITNLFLENMLTDVHDLFQESYNEYKLMHMLINKYIIDDVSYSSFKGETNKDEICLEIKLICISNLITSEIENILKKYQIQVNHYFDRKYLENYSQEEKLDVSHLAYKLKNGINNNEVKIDSKPQRNIGFFEKFFQLFS
tara:strand:+ start:662 stop:1366 length:705 start_codon:yes stop_codon:yes gene_type:complete